MKCKYCKDEIVETSTHTNISTELNKTSHLVSVDDVWGKFNSIKDNYNVETPAELVELAKSSKLDLEDTFIAQLMLIS